MTFLQHRFKLRSNLYADRIVTRPSVVQHHWERYSNGTISALSIHQQLILSLNPESSSLVVTPRKPTHQRSTPFKLSYPTNFARERIGVFTRKTLHERLSNTCMCIAFGNRCQRNKNYFVTLKKYQSVSCRDIRGWVDDNWKKRSILDTLHVLMSVYWSIVELKHSFANKTESSSFLQLSSAQSSTLVILVAVAVTVAVIITVVEIVMTFLHGQFSLFTFTQSVVLLTCQEHRFSIVRTVGLQQDWIDVDLLSVSDDQSLRFLTDLFSPLVFADLIIFVLIAVVLIVWICLPLVIATTT